MNRWLALLLACVALCVVVAGCGNSDDDDGGGNDAQNTEQPAEQGSAGGGGGADAGSGGGAKVSMEGIKFNPASVTVKAGDTVTWTNNDSVGHDVTGDNFKSGDSGGLQNGDTFAQTFDKKGTFDYVCTVHPGMEGSVTVK
jgi:plastocyanin